MATLNKTMMMKTTILPLFIFFSAFLFSCGGGEQANEVNVYTHRHYEVDQDLFKRFTEETGIQVNVINASADELIQRLETEGENSPADVLITVDAGRLNRAHEKGLLQPVRSTYLETAIPSPYREPAGHWFGFTNRARIIAYSKDRVNPADISTYEDLANPKWKGKLLIRSSENVYNQSLLASIIIANGSEQALDWAKGVVSNFARSPKGSDRDQVKAIASGEGDLAVVNTYYIGLLLNSDNEEERKAGESVGLIFPNQDGRGTHVNISGAGVAAHAPNKENAIALLEFLAHEHAQELLAKANFEYPINENVEKADLLESWGDFKKDSVNLGALGQYNTEAVKIFDQAGWQ